MKVSVCIVNQLSNKTLFSVKTTKFLPHTKRSLFRSTKVIIGHFNKNVVINFPEGRWLKREASYLPLYSADVRNEQSYTFAPYLLPWCGQGKFTFNFFMTCYFRSKHAEFAVENKEVIIEVVFDWQGNIGHHAASAIRCAYLWAVGHSKLQDTVSVSSSYQL